MEHIETVFVAMSLSQHKCAGAAQDTVKTMVVVDKYAMIAVVKGAVVMIAQQHAHLVLVLQVEYVVHQQVVAVLRVKTYASRFKMKKKETK